MLRLTSLFITLLGSSILLADPPAQPKTPDARSLIEQLGGMDYRQREEASQQLEAFGADSLDALRAATRSENPEVARRARDIIGRIEYRIANEKILAPTFVELDAKDMPLDSILAELSKQAQCEVVLGGLNPEELARKKITLSTRGKAPFWEAVQKVCERANLQIAVVGGFIAPGSMPLLTRPKSGVRTARKPHLAIALEARDPGLPRRSFAVRGAVLIEVLPFPSNSTGIEPGSVLIQMWPEPKLQWERTVSAAASGTAGVEGNRLTASYLELKRPTNPETNNDRIVLIRNRDGTVTMLREDSENGSHKGVFSANPLQAVLKFKNPEKPPSGINELSVSVTAFVRSPIMALSEARGLAENRLTLGVGSEDVAFTAQYQKDKEGKLTARVTVSHDAKSVIPACLSDELPGVKGGLESGFGNHSVYGILVMDAKGKPFGLGLVSGANAVVGNRSHLTVTLEIVPTRNTAGTPASITFWGTHSQQITIAATLKDVPLAPGK